MKPKIEFGKHVKTTQTEEGNMHRVTTTYRNYAGSEKNYYEERVRVKNETEELQKTLQFMKDKKGKNRSHRVELPKGETDFYYLVLCWED